MPKHTQIRTKKVILKWRWAKNIMGIGPSQKLIRISEIYIDKRYYWSHIGSKFGSDEKK